MAEVRTEHHDHGPAEGMLSVEAARERLLSKIQALAPIDLPLQEAYGCVLAADVQARADLPAFSSSAMDGFAVRAADVAEATEEQPVRLSIAGRSQIGHRPSATVGRGEAVRIDTGAPVPAGADAIAPIEYCLIEGETVQVLGPVAPGRHVRPSAEDVRTDEVIIPAGRRLSAAELGLLAACGFPAVLAHPKPRVVVISTGDELVEPWQPAVFGQVHDANSFTLYGAVKEVGATPRLAGIVRDDVEQLKETILGYLVQADAFISSGGVSVGERDVVKRAFFRRGDLDFYRVAMQPGMPQAFGHIEGKPFFGLPGNPVSVFVSFEVFIRPALLKMMGRSQLFRPELTARLENDIPLRHDRLQFARVRVRRTPDGWTAHTTGSSASNLVSTVARANGLAIVPAGVEAKAGGRVRVMLLRSMED